MQKAALYIAIAAILAACGSKEVKQDVPVTDKSAGTGSTATTSSTSSTTGLPSSTVSSTSLTTGTLANRSVFFDFDSNAVKDEFRPLVQAHSKYMTAEK